MNPTIYVEKDAVVAAWVEFRYKVVNGIVKLQPRAADFSINVFVGSSFIGFLCFLRLKIGVRMSYCGAIFGIHLRRRGRNPDDYDLDHLAKMTAGFSGAEIEQVIVSALYSAYSDNAELDPKYLAEEVSKAKPLSKTRAEDITFLRQWAQERTVSAH